MKQLIQMASDRPHVYTASFRNLDSVIRAIKNKACKGEDAGWACVVPVKPDRRHGDIICGWEGTTEGDNSCQENMFGSEVNPLLSFIRGQQAFWAASTFR